MTFLKRHFYKTMFAALVIAILLTAVLRASYVYHTPKHLSQSKEVLYMDRYTLSDSLVYIFGPQAQSIVVENLFDMGAPIGGSCDFYKMAYDENQKVINPFTRCPAGIRDVNAPMFVKPNAIRIAALNKTCRLLSENENTLEHALNLVHVDKSAAIDLGSVAELYFAFYKMPMEDEAKKAWEPVVKSHPTWALVAYKMCVSPDWQIL